MKLTEFIHQKSYERIEIVARRHPITFFPVLGLFLLITLLPVFLYFFLLSLFTDTIYRTPVWQIIVLVASTYYLSVCLFFYSYFVEFYLDLWIITNDRMLDVAQISLFARRIAEVDLYQIQDITSEVKGFIPSLFDYGSVTIQTAGPVPKFILMDVPHPDDLRQLILNLSSEDKKFHSRVTIPSSPTDPNQR